MLSVDVINVSCNPELKTWPILPQKMPLPLLVEWEQLELAARCWDGPLVLPLLPGSSPPQMHPCSLFQTAPQVAALMELASGAVPLHRPHPSGIRTRHALPHLSFSR